MCSPQERFMCMRKRAAWQEGLTTCSCHAAFSFGLSDFFSYIDWLSHYEADSFCYFCFRKGIACAFALLAYVVPQGEMEACASCLRCIHLNVAAMRQDGVLHDGKTKTCAARFAAAPFVHSVETLKDAWLMLFGYAYAIVGHCKMPIGGLMPCCIRDCSVSTCI